MNDSQEDPKKRHNPYGKYLGPGIAIGIGIGAAIGASSGNMGVGVAVGVALGPAIALLFARKNKVCDKTKSPD